MGVSVLHLWLLLVGFPASNDRVDPSRRYVYPDNSGKLVYQEDAKGNRVPDFSMAGYMGNEKSIPTLPARIQISPKDGDCTNLIQDAIDGISKLPLDKDGFRGALLLLPGIYKVEGQLNINASGVVLCGSGSEKTIIQAKGKSRRNLVQVGPLICSPFVDTVKSYPIQTQYVPVGTYRINVGHENEIKAGQRVLIRHKSSGPWIKSLGMDFESAGEATSYLRWLPGKMDLLWDRKVVKVEGEFLVLDAPLTSPLDKNLADSFVELQQKDNRISNVGVENIRCVSISESANPKDEEHSWIAVCFNRVVNGWVRNMDAVGFCGSAVRLNPWTRNITVQDCNYLSPVSELAGQRRHAFFSLGQLNLFQRLKSEHARHDFSLGHLTCGPNVFLDCESTESMDFSGPSGSWVSGALFDNVRMDGGGLSFTNREIWDQGTGWASANSVFWQCTAPVITNRKPPGSNNWAIGCWAQFVGDGSWRSLNEFVKPRSLFRQQLKERLGDSAEKVLDQKLENRTLLLMEDWNSHLPKVDKLNQPSKKIEISKGWLLRQGEMVSGKRAGTDWWRGSILLSRVSEFGNGITRFVPGMDGPGFTDILALLANELEEKKIAALEHHWGLWYDRRRDDHEMVRRMDSDVWAPFYEQPFARSGKGKAWDGLSKYDLNSYNPWYFSRLREFARLCDQRGLLLFHHAFFQHNILEAGAHWVDFPYRTANCIQDVGFPEPPPFVNNKKIFMADEFYNVNHPVRRSIHKNYIFKCLDELSDYSNVLFFVGEEYTGPVQFVQFWLDAVAEWQKNNGKKVKVCLSCTKDVQDSILSDKNHCDLVSVIDMKYWWYTANGGIYDPKGGLNLAPRQHFRDWKGGKNTSENQLARQVFEYRLKYPEKAIISPLDKFHGVKMTLAGGSLLVGNGKDDLLIRKMLVNAKPDAKKSSLKDGLFVWNLQDESILVGFDGNQKIETGSGDFFVQKIWPNESPKSALKVKAENGLILVQGSESQFSVVRIFR